VVSSGGGDDEEEDDGVEGQREQGLGRGQGQRRGETIEQLHDRVAYTLDRIISNLDDEEDDDNNDNDDNDIDGINGQDSGGKGFHRRRGPRSMLICTHAAVVIAIGRVLTGRMPADVGEADFGAFTCGLSVFVRRQQQPSSRQQPLVDDVGAGARVATDTDAKKCLAVDWKGGRGVGGGGWECVRNSDCSFLAGGAERGW
jgi:transcription factor C subunit 7